MTQQSTPNNQPTNKQTDWLTYAKESVGILSGTLAILVALLWYLGRRAAAGGFAAYNIPLDMVNLSIWEYGERSILSFFLFLVAVVISSFVVIACIKYIGHPHNLTLDDIKWFYFAIFIVIMLGILQLLLNFEYAGNIRFIIAAFIVIIILSIVFRRGYKNRSSIEKDYSKTMFIVFSIFTVLIITAVISEFSFDEGVKNRMKDINTRAVSARIVLDKPLISGLNNVKEIKVNDNILYVYENIYLITQNNQHYFFYNELASNCRPKRVYVVRESDVQSLEYTLGPPLVPNCTPVPTTAPGAITTVTPVQYLPLLQSPTATLNP